MIFPAIDLQDGRSVRLYKGDFAKETIINPDPVDQASQYEAAGVGALHLVDLDGAKAGKPVNVDIVKRVRAAFTGVLEIGGGIRDKDAVDLYLEMGVNRVILGSVALKNPELTKQVIAEYGPECIVIGVDGKNGKVAAEGWLDQSDVPMTDLIGAMVAAGAKYFIVTDVDRDGTMQGANEALLGSLQDQFPTARIVASGGVRHLEDIKNLEKRGVVDSIVGKSLYEGTITLEEIAAFNKEKRIIPCLDVDNGRVKKGVNFVNLVDVGSPVDIAATYEEQGADELVFLDITATVDRRTTMRDVVTDISKHVFMPLTVGGGIKTVDDMSALLKAGADKVSLNSAALARPELISEGAQKFGNQCMVVAIDVKTDPETDTWYVYTHGGRKRSDWEALAWAKEAVSRGAGELLVTSMDKDGTKSGFDIKLYKALEEVVDVPIIASGGAGTVQHFIDVFTETGVTGALAASIFHFGEISIPDLKLQLKAAGIAVR